MKPTSPLINSASSNTENQTSMPDIIHLKLNKLNDIHDKFERKLTRCKNCDAILTTISQINECDTHNNAQTWICEYCSHKNIIPVSNLNIPNNDITTCVIDEQSVQQEASSIDSNYFIFCIDISNSMGKTKKVENQIIYQIFIKINILYFE